MPVRVFIAVDVEDPVIVARLDRVKDALLATGAPLKPVESHNYHLTIRFIGEVDEPVVGEIAREVLDTLEFNRFKIRLHGLGAFPTPARPRVIWVGVVEGAEELKSLHNSVEDRLRRLGFKPEGRGFEPHLTIARVKGSRNIHAVVKILREFRDHDFGWMTVERVRLKKSILTPRGPIYETLHEATAHG